MTDELCQMVLKFASGGGDDMGTGGQRRPSCAVGGAGTMRARSKRRLRWCAALVIAALAPAAGLAPARAASVRPAPTVVARTGRFGFSQGSALLWESDSALAADLDGMAALGASWVAVDVDWPSIQADGPSSWNWGPTDRVVFAARARNIGVLALAVYTPSWARPAGTSDKHPPTDAADYARFVAAGAAPEFDENARIDPRNLARDLHEVREVQVEAPVHVADDRHVLLHRAAERLEGRAKALVRKILRDTTNAGLTIVGHRCNGIVGVARLRYAFGVHRACRLPL